MVESDNVELMEICLCNDANVGVILHEGSLLDAAKSQAMEQLLLAWGAKPAPQELLTLYKVVGSMTDTSVDEESLEMLVTGNFPFRHTYTNGFTAFSSTHVTDVFLTAAQLHNMDVLKTLLPEWKHSADDARLKELILAVFHADFESTADQVPAETACRILQWLHDEGLRFVNTDPETPTVQTVLELFMDCYRYNEFYTADEQWQVQCLLWSMDSRRNG